MNIYFGKDGIVREGGLGKQLIKKLALSIKKKDVTLAFDHFFTSVSLMNTLNFLAVETCIKNRKNMPKNV